MFWRSGFATTSFTDIFHFRKIFLHSNQISYKYMAYLPVVFVWWVSAESVSEELSQPVSLSVRPHTATDQSNHIEIYSLPLYLSHSANSSTQVTHISVHKTRNQ